MPRQRRNFTPELKTEVVLEVLTGVKSTAAVCRERKLKESVVSRWKTEFLERAGEIFAPPDAQVAQAERIAELERLVGRLTLEQEVAKKACGLFSSLSRRNGR